MAFEGLYSLVSNPLAHPSPRHPPHQTPHLHRNLLPPHKSHGIRHTSNSDVQFRRSSMATCAVSTRNLWRNHAQFLSEWGDSGGSGELGDRDLMCADLQLGCWFAPHDHARIGTLALALSKDLVPHYVDGLLF
jgi:hypothetical protein